MGWLCGMMMMKMMVMSFTYASTKNRLSMTVIPCAFLVITQHSVGVTDFFELLCGLFYIVLILVCHPMCCVQTQQPPTCSHTRHAMGESFLSSFL